MDRESARAVVMSRRHRAAVPREIRPKNSNPGQRGRSFDGASSNLQWLNDKKTTPEETRTTVPTLSRSLSLVQRDDRRNAHRATRRQIRRKNSNEQKQARDAAERERIVTAHTEQLAF